MTGKAKSPSYAICVENAGYEASLELRKVYALLDAPTKEARGLVRVVDESGEDYLFPQELFVPIKLPRPAQRSSAFSVGRAAAEQAR